MAANSLKELFTHRLSEIGQGITSKSADLASALQEFQSLPLFAPIRDGLASGLNELRRSVAYVGPVRAYPARYYSLAKQRQIADPFGEHLSQMLAFWKEQRSPRFTEVKQSLVQLELATDLNANLELGEFLKVTVKPKGRLFPDTLADVGFGVSQILPVLVSDTALDDGGTLLVNQPEIHLHPSSQALLGNYFADRIGRRRYVVETHSEYLITRLRLLVAKGALKEKDVVIYYVGSAADSSEAEISKVTLRKNGRLEGMPKDFFTTYASDTFQLAMSVMGNDDATE